MKERASESTSAADTSGQARDRGAGAKHTGPPLRSRAGQAADG